MKVPSLYRAELAFVALASTATAPLTARAQMSADVALEARYQQGADLRDQHQDAQALAIFREIYSQTRHPRALAQVAMAEGALGQWLDAERHLSTALNAPDAWITTRRTALDGALATIRSHLGRLEVLTPTPSAEVWIDGRRVGSANAPLRVLAGTAQFELRALGHVPITRIATIPVGGLARETLPALVASTPVGPSVTGDVAPTLARSVSPSATTGMGSARRTLAIASLVAGGVVLAGGVGAWAYGWTVASDYNSDTNCPAPGAAMIPVACQSRLDAARVVEPLAWAGMITGAGLLATGAILMATVPRAPSDRAARFVSGPGDVGVGFRLAF